MPVYRKYARDSVRIVSNEAVAPDHYAMTLLDAEIAGETKPGQFYQVRLKGPGAPFLPRPFSIYDWHLDGSGRKAGVTILYKVIGIGTAALSRLNARRRGRPHRPSRKRVRRPRGRQTASSSSPAA